MTKSIFIVVLLAMNFMFFLLGFKTGFTDGWESALKYDPNCQKGSCEYNKPNP